MSALIWVLLSAAWAADSAVDLPAIAASDGMGAVAEKLEQMRADAKNDKKFEAAVATSGLETLKVPVSPILGAELTVSSFTELTGCKMSEGSITCRFGGTVAGKVEAGEYTAICKSKYGSKLNLDIKLLAADDTRAAWEATDVQDCFGMNVAKITVQPLSHDDLEGVGEGTEFIPPELTGLTWQQVEKIILKTVPTFKICYQKQEGEQQTGKLVIAFEIADDGSLAKVETESSYLDDKGVEACILERFGRITFPPPMGGYTKGTFPFQLQ